MVNRLNVDMYFNQLEAQRIGFYSGILIDAVESGAVGSWAGVRNYEWKDQSCDLTNYITASAQLVPYDPEYVKAPMQEMFRFGVDDSGNPIKEKRVAVDHTLVRKGLNKVLSGEVEASDWIIKACKEAKKEWDGSYMDAVCANVVLQAAVFEENIYD